MMSILPGKNHKRGIFLSSFLILLGIINLIFGFNFLLGFSEVKQLYSNLPDIAIILYGLVCLANAGFAVAIWYWHKWGVFGYAASVTIAYFFNGAMTGNFTGVTGFLGLIVLIIMIIPVWKDLK
jgi:hypothetical protein